MLRFYYSNHCKFCTLAKEYLREACPNAEFILTSFTDDIDVLPVLEAIDEQGNTIDRVVGFGNKSDYKRFVEDYSQC